MKINLLLHKRTLFSHTLIGATLGVIILHPLTMLLFWNEFSEYLNVFGDSAWLFFKNRITNSAYDELVLMTAVFSLIGGTIGWFFAIYHINLLKQHNIIRYLEHELEEGLLSLIARGESERLEFKMSLRWDFRLKRANRVLEQVIAKAIAGFLNHQGGTLLIGVEDNGEIVGLQSDFQTLKHKNTDGFERALMDLVKTFLGGNACALVHCRFHTQDESIVCRINIEKSNQPVYLNDGKTSRYMLRTGNATSELDAEEAHSHILGQ